MVKKLEEKFLAERRYEDSEREKTNEEKEIIGAIIEKLNVFLSQYGAKPLDIRETHVHILDKSKMSDDLIRHLEGGDVNTSAFYEQDKQIVVVLGWTIKSPLQFAQVISHELIHFLAFNAVQIDEKYNDGFVSHRTGLAVRQKNVATPSTRSTYFNDIDEAVTEELTKRFYPQLQDIPPLENEYKNILKAREKFSNPDVAAIRVKEIEAGQIPSLEITMKDFAYAEVRKKFNELIDKIYEKKKDSFSSREEVFNIFARAAMTGEVKELATLVESTSGTGTFKKIAQSLSH
ncbi:MAG: hypothetical protein A3A96_03685 [Candidatus Zambryskibacteria bacterium RIFCSPLOWO2_01_FULL_39_39]|uniref:Uncharacterized protein n=1 Tax=Candidatus Zambryskibacteria bacterium RIFCSPLOWO2_01_FULL_39_39 TaxID=1802758 RepID=A0A1G2TXP7_9BACT|nr:MAG: hypothetical protein A2644_00950 [Candidatus Zambryskibacteria bacterium RIFCSPHIGHO2_01_FULL_39_63]OHA94595.1 MAG: hypothetical protein A3B88_00080 [Candidatus Zambryskibacteria bacterium RIFCSPHIGHO2_02_FULL_39_19]OHA98629.1 MAG: hypothetical protein A3F20_00015 [Candidatus Zambryskibacteria bacterium RIFCSPHIGHO2_12_FULL_39_21]OHB02078.1 MAG: hypothetical protein A3A96_03685 [Candidatus Zambryskibacteria bacterium RIFCSPLOWO2_01_FULL_39_39]